LSPIGSGTAIFPQKGLLQSPSGGAYDRTPDSVKRYRSAKERFLKPVIVNFFSRECPKVFGPVLRDKLADELLCIFEDIVPQSSQLKPGQIL
jgi:hypothetical protein